MTEAYLTNKLVFKMTPAGGTEIPLSGENGLVPFTIPRTSPNRVIPSQTSGMRRQKTGRTDSTWSVTCDWNTETKVIAQHLDDVWDFTWQPAGDGTGLPQATGKMLISGLTPGSDDNGGLTMSFDCEMTGQDIDWSDQS